MSSNMSCYYQYRRSAWSVPMRVTPADLSNMLSQQNLPETATMGDLLHKWHINAKEWEYRLCNADGSPLHDSSSSTKFFILYQKKDPSVKIAIGLTQAVLDHCMASDARQLLRMLTIDGFGEWEVEEVLVA